MNQLTPNSPFTFVIQLGDPTDSGQNYVQSVVRLSASSKVVATMNMANVSGQRFTGTFNVPADVSGLGYYLDITTTVYTDSGYSSLNTNYPIQTVSFFVLQPFTSSAVGGNTGGYSDGEEFLKRLARIEAIVLGIKIPEFKETDLSEVIELISAVQNSLPETVDLEPTHRRIADVYERINAIKMPEIPKPDKVDLYPLIEGLQNIVKGQGEFEKRMTKMHDAHRKEIRDLVYDHVTSITKDTKEEVRKAIDEKKGELFQIHVSPLQRPQLRKEPELDPKIKNLFP